MLGLYSHSSFIGASFHVPMNLEAPWCFLAVQAWEMDHMEAG